MIARIIALTGCIWVANGLANAQTKPVQPEEISRWFALQYRKCWSIPLNLANHPYKPQVVFELGQDGKLTKPPAIRNPPRTEQETVLAEAAIRAITRCNSLEVPKHFLPQYQHWRSIQMRFVLTE